MDQTTADSERGLDCTENTRLIPASDPDFPPLYAIRQDAESNNRALDDTLYLRRAHSYGNSRQWVDLLGYGLMVNSLALLLAEQRKLAPPVAA